MRRVTSIILAIAFLILSITGIQLSMHGGKPVKAQQQVTSQAEINAPQVVGDIAFSPKKVHEWAGFLFIAAGMIHLGLNIRPMVSYIGIKRLPGGRRSSK